MQTSPVPALGKPRRAGAPQFIGGSKAGPSGKLDSRLTIQVKILDHATNVRTSELQLNTALEKLSVAVQSKAGELTVSIGKLQADV